MAADDPLQPLLDEAEAKLSRGLRKACGRSKAPRADPGLEPDNRLH